MRLLGSLLILVLVFGGLAPAGEDDHDNVTLKGQFIWDRPDEAIPGDIEAVFTSTGEKSWDVVFHFEWEGEMRAWKGTAQGSLDNGKLEGEATEDRDRERTFVFNGDVEGGSFKGEHGSMRDGEMKTLGTLTLDAG